MRHKICQFVLYRMSSNSRIVPVYYEYTSIPSEFLMRCGSAGGATPVYATPQSAHDLLWLRRVTAQHTAQICRASLICKWPLERLATLSGVRHIEARCVNSALHTINMCLVYVAISVLPPKHMCTAGADREAKGLGGHH